VSRVADMGIRTAMKAARRATQGKGARHIAVGAARDMKREVLREAHTARYLARGAKKGVDRVASQPMVQYTTRSGKRMLRRNYHYFAPQVQAAAAQTGAVVQARATQARKAGVALAKRTKTRIDRKARGIR
jgi:hypothetical protein